MCKANCTLNICGDGKVYNGVEQCDDGNNNNTDACTNGCKLPTCGDMIISPPEECEDGNNSNTDTCNVCKKTYCGDHIIQKPNGFGKIEQCDDGNKVDNDSCSNACEINPG